MSATSEASVSDIDDLNSSIFYTKFPWWFRLIEGEPDPRMPPMLKRFNIINNRFSGILMGLRDDDTHKILEYGQDAIRRPVPRLPKPLANIFYNWGYFGWRGDFVQLHTPRLVRDYYTLPADSIHLEAGWEWPRAAVGNNSPFMLAGDKHKKIRHFLTRELTQKSVEQYREVTIDVMDRLIDEMPLNTPVSLADFFQSFTQEMILRATFGFTDEDQQEIDELKAFLNSCMHDTIYGFWNLIKILTVMYARPWRLGEGHDDIPRWMYPRGARIKAIADKLVYEKIEELKQRPNNSFAARLVSLQKKDPFWSDKVLRDILVTQVIAGHETSVSGYAWAVHYLLSNKDARKQLEKEAILGKTDRYAQAANNEALRLKSPMFGLLSVTRKDVEVGPYFLREGTVVFVPSSVIHHDPAAYPDPDSFKPERFLDKAPDRFAYIPFGLSRHRCPGINFYMIEANIMLHRMFGRLDMDLCESRTPETTKLGGAFFNRPRSGVNIIVKERKKASEVPCFKAQTLQEHERQATMRAPLDENFFQDGSPVAAEPVSPTGAPVAVEICPYAASTNNLKSGNE